MSLIPSSIAVLLTLTRIITSVVTGQAPVTLDWKIATRKHNAQGKKK